MTTPLPTLTLDAMLERYALLLFDAYGVLVRTQGAIEGAQALIEHLNAQGRAYFILTNDASRHLSTSWERFEALGLPIPQERIITSGSLLTPWVRAHGLRGADAVVLGPPDSHRYAREAGLTLVDPERATSLDALVIGDMPRADAVAELDAAVSALLRTLDAGRLPKLALPNPDLIYPIDQGRVGLTAGAIAVMVERILRERYPGLPAQALTFERLGKPHAAIFQAGLDQAGVQDKSQVIMVGDQLVTDILGAHDFGIDSALVQTGLVRLDHHAPQTWPARPTYLLESLWR